MDVDSIVRLLLVPHVFLVPLDGIRIVSAFLGEIVYNAKQHVPQLG